MRFKRIVTVANSQQDALPSKRLSRRQLLKMATGIGVASSPVLGSLLAACSDGANEEREQESQEAGNGNGDSFDDDPPLSDDSGSDEGGMPVSQDSQSTSTPADPGPQNLLTWYAVNINWEVHNNKAQMITQHEQGRLLLDTGTPDHAIEATIDLPAGEAEHYAGLFIRYEDEGNFIHARYLEQSGNSEIEVFQRWNDSDRLIIFMNFRHSINGTTRRLRVAANGGQVAVYDHDELMGQGATDVTSGTLAGIGAFGDQPPAGIVTWEDVAVSATEASDPEEPQVSLCVHDRFSDDEIAVTDSSRPADPGPGKWIVKQSDDLLEIRDEVLRIASANDWNDPGLWTESAIPRSELGALTAVMRVEGGTHGAGLFLSGERAPSNPFFNSHGLCITTAELLVANSDVLIRPPGPLTEASNRSVDHLLTVVPREGGGTFLAASGGNFREYPEASLLWIGPDGLEDSELYAGIASAPDTIVSIDDIRVVPIDELPEALTGRYGIAICADAFDTSDESSGSNLAGRATPIGDLNWNLPSGVGTINADGGYLEPSTDFYALVEPGPGPRFTETTFRVGDSVGNFGLLIRAESPDSGRLYFGYFQDRNAWGLWDDDDGMIWSTGANTDIVEDNADVRLCVIDNGRNIRAFANNVDLMGEAWIEIPQRRESGWAGIFHAGDDGSLVVEFAIWPRRIELNEAFDALRDPPEAADPLAIETFDASDGSELDERPVESSGD
jgi:hypothetical protein